jgi:hypothetical protein
MGITFGKGLRAGGFRTRAVLGATVTAMAAVGMVATLDVGPSAAAPVSRTLHYTCASGIIGSAADITIDADVPTALVVGRPSSPFTVRGTVAVDPSFEQYAAILGATSVDGTVVGHGTAVAPEGNQPKDITMSVARTAIPTSGAFTLTATGSAPSVTLNQPGQGKITIGDFTAEVIPRNASGAALGTISGSCSLDAGQDNVLGTFEVTQPPPPPPTPAPTSASSSGSTGGGNPGTPTAVSSGTRSGASSGGSDTTGGGTGGRGGPGTNGGTTGGPGGTVPTTATGGPSASGSAAPTTAPPTPGPATASATTTSPKPSGVPLGAAPFVLPVKHAHFPYPLLIAAVLVAAGIAAAVLTVWIRKRRLRATALAYGHVSEPVDETTEDS